MTDLPKGWCRSSIGGVTKPFMSVDPARSPERRFRYVDIGSIDNRTQSIGEPKVFSGADAPSRARRVIQTGDTLFSTVRTYLKNIALVPVDLDGELTSTGIAVLRPDRAVDERFLFHWARSDEFVGLLSRAQDGTMYPAVSDGDVVAAQIPVPPLPEQRRIVAKIDSLSAKSKRAREHLDHLPRLVEKYKQAVLDQAFAGSWAREALISMVSPDRRIPYGIVQTGTAQADGVPTVRGGDIKDFRVHKDRLKLVERDVEAAYPRTRLRGGEVLISIRGSVGDACVAGPDLIGCNISREVAMIPVTEAMDPTFVMFFLASTEARSFILGNVRGVAQQGINLEDLRKLPTPKPPLSEQREIARRIRSAIDWIDRIAREATSARALLDRLDQTILAKAFRGELVPQEANDEPASVLLDRIRAERSAAPAKPGRRKSPT